MPLPNLPDSRNMPLSIYLCLGSLLLFTGLTTECRAQSKEAVLRIEPGPGNPRNSEGDFIRLQDGRVLFVYSHYDGESTSDHASAYLAGRYSDDQGKTWTPEDQVILENEGDLNVMSVSLLRLPDNRIALFYLRKNSTSDCIPLMRTSADEGQSWSAANPVITDREGYFVLNNDRVVQLSSGRLIVPVALHNTPEGAWSNGAEIYTYYSDDSGNSWKSSAQVGNPGSIMLQEPGVVELVDGRLMLFMRTDEGVQYLSYSQDQGQSWSAVEPSEIASPVSPASVERIPGTRDLLMVWNNNLSEDEKQAQRRTPLTIAVSQDEGASWKYVKTLESDPDGWYCYTAISFEDDHLLLAYCAGNRPQGTGLSVTQITRVATDWLYQHP